MPVSSMKVIHSMKWSGSMGCCTEPMVILNPPSIFSTAGTCFSFAASVVFAVMCSIGLPQQINSFPAPAWSTWMMFPQIGHL